MGFVPRNFDKQSMEGYEMKTVDQIGTIDGMGTILYDYGRGLYANITNKCPCRCDFCIRDMTDAIGSADTLWLKREPSVEEFIETLMLADLSMYDELVFCGYGEPTERLDDVLTIAKYVKEHTHLAVRINTNGLSDLINKRPTAELMSGLIDCVSVSLNQSDAKKYQNLCHSRFGEASYQALLDFTKDAQKYIPKVAMSVVGVIPQEDEDKCIEIAAEYGISLRIR